MLPSASPSRRANQGLLVGARGWIDRAGDPCGNPPWSNVVCDSNNAHVIRISMDSWGAIAQGQVHYLIGKLSALTSITWNGAYITGSLPTEMQYLTALNSLILYNCRLTAAPFPAQLYNLNRSLTELVIGVSQMNGRTPSQISALTSLTTLNLRGNFLSGSIPTEFGLMTRLQNLNLAYNPITGEPGRGCRLRYPRPSLMPMYRIRPSHEVSLRERESEAACAQREGE